MNPLTNMKNVIKLSQQELGNIGKSSWHDQYRDSAWIYVGGLPFDLTEGDIICIFSQYGEIVNINLIRAKDTGKSKGFCFLCYEDQRSTILAVDNLNGIKILNRTIRVDHVAAYKAPKDHKKDTDETKKLHDEGCAPKPIVPIMTFKKEPIDNTQRETLKDQIEQDIKLPARLPIYPHIKQEASDTEVSKKEKKSKKKKKKKKKSKRSDTDDSGSSEDEDKKKQQQEIEERERKAEEMRKKMEEREEKRLKVEEIRKKREEKEKRRFGAKKRERSKTPEKEPIFRKRDVSPSIPTRWR